MTDTAYTLARWHVRPGREDAFIAAWEHLAHVFSGLAAPPRWGTLIRSEQDPTLFYSFGPWRDPADVAAMRADPVAAAALDALRKLCLEATPAGYRLVRHVDVPGLGAPAQE